MTISDFDEVTTDNMGSLIATKRAKTPGAKRVLAWKAGYGFVMPEDEAVAMRRAGKQVLNVDDAGAACVGSRARDRGRQVAWPKLTNERRRLAFRNRSNPQLPPPRTRRRWTSWCWICERRRDSPTSF